MEKQKQETIEEAAEIFFNKRAKEEGFENWIQIIVHQEWEFIELFPVEFAKWQQEQDKNKYSEEDMAESFVACWKSNVPDGIECKVSFKEWFEQFKKK
jgi:hypothetical protein